MHRIIQRIAVLALAVPALWSCRSWILEDRTDCPGFLFFEFVDRQSLDDAGYMYVEAMDAANGSFLNRDTTTVGAMAKKEYYMPVTKVEVAEVFGASGFNRSQVENHSQWVIEEGEDGDPLYRFSARVEASGESAVVPVEMTKEYSTVTVRFKMPEGYGVDGRFPFYIIVTSNTCGLDIQSGAPVRGAYRFQPEETQDGLFQFTVPRQADQSLMLEIWAKEGMYEEEGHLDDLMLWTFLKQVEGFNWSLKNIPDLTIDIDYVRSKVVIYVKDWQIGTQINYEI